MGFPLGLCIGQGAQNRSLPLKGGDFSPPWAGQSLDLHPIEMLHDLKWADHAKKKKSRMCELNQFGT